MKGLVYHAPGQGAWETVPDRRIEAPTDAIVRIDTSTICGTDLHILKGDVPEVFALRDSCDRPAPNFAAVAAILHRTLRVSTEPAAIQRLDSLTGGGARGLLGPRVARLRSIG